jgi:malonyl CoA-acyl carrier protein transacylase
MKRLAVLCPGRGSYTETSLGSLPQGHPWVERADQLRAEYRLPPLSELDAAAQFDRKEHLRPVNVSGLIWLVAMLDAAEAARSGEVVCVAGNSMGWYIALAVGGALDFDDGFRLVQEMAIFQEEHQGGGQLLYPLVDDDWRLDPERAGAVEAALAAAPGDVFPSIHLGGFAVLAGTNVGMSHLLKALPPVALGRNRYPLRLMGHGPYHTPLVIGVSDRARMSLARLAWRRPQVTLIDGRGVRFTPWATDVERLRDYTLREQVIEPFDFTRSVRVALREYGPDELVLPGPGNTLGAICGQIVAAEGWRSVHDKAGFEALQASSAPLVRSMRR